MNAPLRTVVLVHGLWMGPWAMGLLKRRLIRAGFRVKRFGYRPVGDPFETSAERLARFIEGLGPAPVGILAHSLGGLLSAAAIAQKPESKGRLLCLGSPLAGSAVARKIHAWPGGRFLLGHAAQVLKSGIELPQSPDWTFAQIAGSRRLGMGLVAGGGRWPGDGTVAIEETWAEGLAAHRVLSVTHTSLLSSRRVAESAAGFLSGGGLGDFESTHDRIRS